jgi:sugar lactone lactonase YvrE
MKVELLLDAHAELGESPAWDAAAGVLYWVDIHAGRLHTFDPSTGANRTLDLGEPIGCLAPIRGGGMILALRSGFWSLHPPAVTPTRLPSPGQVPGNRFNDGKCDPAGRFLAGTMDEAEKEARGSLYSCAPGGQITTLLTGLGISNGLTWSPDYKTFYFIDTPTRRVIAYDYNLDTGGIANPRPVVYVPEGLGWPDGMTSDTEGKLWIALWGGARVTCWDPGTGQLTASHPLPALNVTSCVFGGADLLDLYITSARKGMSRAELDEYPLSGGLFRLQAGVCGLPTFEFGGGMG